MALLKSFIFSQGSLQDFVDCPHRFELRYLRRLAWPAVETEPVHENERRKRLGDRFHRLAQQRILGLPVDRLEIGIEEGELGSWWQAFLACEWSRPLEGACTYPEIVLTAPFIRGRMVAKYDLLVIDDRPPYKAVIVDWKTSRHLPRRENLMAKLQSRVYPYLLVKAGGPLAGRPLLPGQVSMVYWYSAFPDKQQLFPYSPERFDQDDAYLRELVGQIENMADSGFPMVEDEAVCRWCTYRSLCSRGVRAGDLDDFQVHNGAASEFDEPFDFNFDSVEPVKSF
jgi:CRISPR/Cas system-associated exonuclease Cas4 (RecB family)